MEKKDLLYEGKAKKYIGLMIRKCYTLLIRMTPQPSMA